VKKTRKKITVLMMVIAFSLMVTAVITVQYHSVPAAKAADEAVAEEAGIVIIDHSIDGPKTSAARDPVILVHGYIGGYGLTPWGDIVDDLWDHGWTSIWEIYYTDPIYQSNVDNAAELAWAVDYVLGQTGASKVDLVCHSMGGLSARWYIKFMGGASKVDDYVSLGSPHHGTPVAILGFWTEGGREMLPGSSFLNTLNAGDETPGSVHYTAIYAYADELVIPYSTAKLYDGATNKGKWWVMHISMLFSGTIQGWIRDAIYY
jgi:triacylglycerol lipase